MDSEADARMIWIASYPKSGNTWMRAFLCNLLTDAHEPMDINNMSMIGNAADPRIFEEETGMEFSEFTHEELLRLRPRVYERYLTHTPEPAFLKVHDAYLRRDDGFELFPRAITRGVINIVRNPLDVAVSYAGHRAKEYDEIIQTMADPEHCLSRGKRKLPFQLTQRLGTWSEHVTSWADQTALPMLVVRYEDMLATPVETFSSVVAFCGLPHGEEQVARAVRMSAFKNLKEQEQQKGFREKAVRAECFFRSGRSGDWTRELSQAQAERVVADHGEAMRRFGYETGL